MEGKFKFLFVLEGQECAVVEVKRLDLDTDGKKNKNQNHFIPLPLAFPFLSLPILLPLPPSFQFLSSVFPFSPSSPLLLSYNPPTKDKGKLFSWIFIENGEVKTKFSFESMWNWSEGAEYPAALDGSSSSFNSTRGFTTVCIPLSLSLFLSLFLSLSFSHSFSLFFFFFSSLDFYQANMLICNELIPFCLRQN